MHEVVIRAAAAEDAEAVGRMHWAAWQEAYTPLIGAGYFTAERKAERIARWRRSLTGSNDAVTVRIADRDGAVLGLAVSGTAQPDHPGGAPVRQRELWSLYVRESEYGTGLGAQLLEAVLPARTGDVAPAQLWVFEANRRARAFYEKHGFRPDGARNVFGADLAHQPEIRMVR